MEDAIGSWASSIVGLAAAPAILLIVREADGGPWGPSTVEGSWLSGRHGNGDQSLASPGLAVADSNDLG